LKDATVALRSDTQITLEMGDKIVPGDFSEWKSQTLLTSPSEKGEKTDQTEMRLMTALRLFPVANKTPIECMQFITELQRDIEGSIS
jgi:hypothetical protein